ncbi:unnamed protein product, partial [Trichogramma brassicae]
MASSTKNVEANECLEVLTNFIDKEILQNQVQLNDIIWPEQNLNGQNDNYESFANSTDSGFEPNSGMTPTPSTESSNSPPPNDIEDFVSAPTSSQNRAKEKIDTRCIRQPTSAQETKEASLRRLNPLSITYTRPIRSRRNNPTVKVMRELPRKNKIKTRFEIFLIHAKSSLRINCIHTLSTTLFFKNVLFAIILASLVLFLFPEKTNY